MHIARIILTCSLAATMSCVSATPSNDGARAAEVTVRTFIAAWESGDRALIEELFWPEATYDDFANQHTYQGVEEIVDYMLAVHDWADDVSRSVGRIHPTDNGAVAEWVFSAVQARPVGNEVPVASGADVFTNGLTVLEMEGDRIIRAADYLDTTPMLLQMGGRIEMPGGVVLEGSR